MTRGRFERGAFYDLGSDVLEGYTVFNGRRIPEYTYQHLSDRVEYVGWTVSDGMMCTACCRRIRGGVVFRSAQDGVYAFGRHCVRKHVVARRLDVGDGEVSE